MKSEMKRRGKKIEEYEFVECEVEVKGIMGMAILPKHKTKGYQKKSEELKIRELRRIR